MNEKFNAMGVPPQINYKDLIGLEEIPKGEYERHVMEAARLLALARTEKVAAVDESLFIERYRSAKNAYEVLKINEDLIGLLSDASVDYFGIIINEPGDEDEGVEEDDDFGFDYSLLDDKK